MYSGGKLSSDLGARQLHGNLPDLFVDIIKSEFETRTRLFKFLSFSAMLEVYGDSILFKT